MRITQADRDALAANLRRLRQEAGLTQDQLADKALLHRSTISRLENAKRWPETVTALLICRALGVSLETLTGEAFWAATEGRNP
jgi:transcriptional regulator with XRE-family HTH domain